MGKALLGFHQNQQVAECLRGCSGFKGYTVNISGCISRKGSGLAFFQGPEVPLLTLPSIFPENPGWLQILTTPMRESQLKLGGTDLSGPSLPTSWQTMKALVTWYLAQGESVGEVIIPFENGVTIANVSLRHLKDNNKSIGN